MLILAFSPRFNAFHSVSEDFSHLFWFKQVKILNYEEYKILTMKKIYHPTDPRHEWGFI